MPIPQALIDTALVLRAQGHDTWEAFVSALEANASQAALDMVTASPEHLAIAQGRAQAMRSLAHDMRTVVQLKENSRRAPK